MLLSPWWFKHAIYNKVASLKILGHFLVLKINESFRQNYILHNYAIPQVVPHAMHKLIPPFTLTHFIDDSNKYKLIHFTYLQWQNSGYCCIATVATKIQDCRDICKSWEKREGDFTFLVWRSRDLDLSREIYLISPLSLKGTELNVSETGSYRE